MTSISSFDTSKVFLPAGLPACPKGILAMCQPLVSGTFRLEEAIPQEDAIEDAANVSLPLMSLYR